VTTIVREVAGIILDALLGSRCVLCGCRDRNLAAHAYFDHGDERPA
jgi:hypothetical protein